MLQTDEIEEDYFTPASSTTLANIFGKKGSDQKTENESLKYTPPKPQNVGPKPEETKTTQCIFACALYGYEWFNNVYTSKGKLGFAIIKIIKTGYHNVVLYDSNKTTLSCATVSQTLEITVKNNVYISYFDNMQKYWSLYSTEDEVKKIIETLKSLNAVIKYSSEDDKGPPLPIKNETDSKPVEPAPETPVQIDRESDTDSSVNKRTKMSILNRMANMGHSVLPPNTLAIEKTSDSSDTNESNNYSKTVPVRHKTVKSSIKRNSADKNMEQSLIEVHKIRTEANIENASPLYTFVGGQLVPVNSTNIMMGTSSNTNEMNVFMSEQRISNSEMRINMTRVTDKIDHVLEKISDLNLKDKDNVPSNFQNEILQKLLNEYETKIKAYEEIIKTKRLDKSYANTKLPQELIKSQPSEEVQSLKKKLSEVLEINKDKDNLILTLQSELKSMKEQNKKLADLERDKSTISQENQGLKHELVFKNEEIEKLKEQLQCTLGEISTNENSVDKIKVILNDTFHGISANFESHENYKGETIKSIVATVIKRAFEVLTDQDKK